MAREKWIDKQNNIQIQTLEWWEEISPILLVQAWKYDIGVVGASQFFSAVDNGADIVAIAAASHKDLTVFATKKDSWITNVEWFSGKIMGRLEWATTDIVYQVLKNKLNITWIQEISAPWDLKTFILWEYDIKQAYINDEPLSLAKEWIETNIIDPNDYGVHFIGDIYFTRREFIQENPELIQNFINTIGEWREITLQDMTGAINAYKIQYPNVDYDKDLLWFTTAKEYYAWEGNKVLYVSEDKWQNMADELTNIGIIKSFDVKKHIDNSFVNNYHAQK